MKKLLFITSIIFMFNAFSQNDYVKQVLILNECYLDYATDEIIEPVTVGVYSIASSDPSCSQIIEISGAKFATDLIIDGDIFMLQQMIGFQISS